ncbi:phosphoribosylglycinamide formyltransferase [Nocardia sp. 2]|uniref:Phosphoribosylglycinamide formyltransferase n=1 Tax=Nocardia acididurans TaxID=2802282 RepID=A0ABS1M448_9NOCA|nr:phosphoribosylglycinamide formyltransferase [Nocardia acididurans]MBL1075438.1 phosphoribosylglycinamide formyltransferase [Nocardia acididurans]
MTPTPAQLLPPTAPATVVVLASGTGSLLRSLLEATRAPGYPAQVVAVGVDRDCAATDHAEAFDVSSFKVALGDFEGRAEWDHALTEIVSAFAPDLVVSAGFMKILGPKFLDRFGGRIINTHPALLPAFPGAHGVRDALAYGVRVTGSTVHLVDAGVDTGPILAQEAVVIEPEDDESTLHERIKVVERRLLAETVAAVANRGIISDGRKAVIPDERVLR